MSGVQAQVSTSSTVVSKMINEKNFENITILAKIQLGFRSTRTKFSGPNWSELGGVYCITILEKWLSPHSGQVDFLCHFPYPKSPGRKTGIATNHRGHPGPKCRENQKPTITVHWPSLSLCYSKKKSRSCEGQGHVKVKVTKFCRWLPPKRHFSRKSQNLALFWHPCLEIGMVVQGQGHAKVKVTQRSRSQEGQGNLQGLG